MVKRNISVGFKHCFGLGIEAFARIAGGMHADNARPSLMGLVVQRFVEKRMDHFAVGRSEGDRLFDVTAARLLMNDADLEILELTAFRTIWQRSHDL